MCEPWGQGWSGLGYVGCAGLGWNGLEQNGEELSGLTSLCSFFRACVYCYLPIYFSISLSISYAPPPSPIFLCRVPALQADEKTFALPPHTHTASASPSPSPFRSAPPQHPQRFRDVDSGNSSNRAGSGGIAAIGRHEAVLFPSAPERRYLRRH